MATQPMFGSRSVKRDGRCFELAFHYVVDPRHAYASLVHGWVDGPRGFPRIPHAWIEFAGVVFDPVLNHATSIAEYARIAGAVASIRYSPREAAALGIEHGHYGPWLTRVVNGDGSKNMTPEQVDAHFLSEIGPAWRELRGGMWHITASHRFRGILEAGEIQPNPDLGADKFRWAADGTTWCRARGGVSLFDFRDADWPAHFGRHFPDSLATFLHPHGCVPTDEWVSAVCLRLDRGRLPGFVSIAEIAAEQKPRGLEALLERWMPGVEACHRGPVPLTACSHILVICEADRTEFRRIDLDDLGRADAALTELEADWSARFAEHYRVRALSPRERLKIAFSQSPGDGEEQPESELLRTLKARRRRALGDEE